MNPRLPTGAQYTAESGSTELPDLRVTACCSTDSATLRAVSVLVSLVAGPLVVQLVFMGHAAMRWAAAKRLKLEVARVRLGWGPKVWAHNTRDGVAIEVRLLPPLAMVAIRGHDPAAEEDSYRGLYGRSDLGKRVLLTLASPAYYVGLTVLPLFAIGLVAGWPETTTPSPMIVAHVEPSSPADDAGIEPDDVILTANGQRVGDVQGLIAVVSPRAGLPTPMELRRGERKLTVSVTPVAPAGQPRARIGVLPKTVRRWKPLGVLEAAANSVTFPGALFGQQITAVALLFQPQQRETLAGPIAMSTLVADSEPGSRLQVALFVATAYLVSFWLLLCLPLPFCPCGRLLLLVPEALGRAQPSLRTERWLTRATVGVYVALLVVVTVSDVAGSIAH